MVQPYPTSNPWDGVASGYKLGNALRQDQARSKAGNALAGGDYTGAAGALMSGGDVEGGARLQYYGQQRENLAADNTRADAEQKAKREEEGLKYAASLAGRLADFHARTKDINRTLAAFDSEAPRLQSLAGETPEEIAQIRQRLQTDPEGTLAAMGAGAKKYQLANGGDGYLGAFDPESGTLNDLHAGHPKPIEMDPEKTYLMPDAAGATPAAAPAAAPASAPAATGGGFDAVYHGFVAPHEGGYTASDGNGAPANFGINQKANPEVDVKSLTADGAKTILHDKYWVPSGAENLPPALQAVHFDTAVNMGVGAAQNLLQQSGGDPQKYLQLREQRYKAIAAGDPSKAAKLPGWLARNEDLAHYVSGQGDNSTASAATAPDMVAAEAKARELGVAWNPAMLRANTPAALAYQAKLGIAAPAPASESASAIPGYHTIQAGHHTPDWQPDGHGNLVNAKTGDRKVDPTFDGTVPANADLVKAIIDGRAPVPTTGRQSSDPKWQAAMGEAMRQDPTLDAANYGTRVKTRADFATGAAAKTKTALNTALGHAGDLDSQIDALGNTGIPKLNALGNLVGANVSDDRKASLNTFQLTKEALMHEALKVFSGSAGSLTEFKQLADTLDVNDGPKAQHAVVKKLVGLLASKMDALGEQYRTGMGRDLDLAQIMSPHAQSVFSKITGIPTDRPQTAAPAAPAAHADDSLPVLTPQQASGLKPGTRFRSTDGRVLVRH